MAYYDTLIAAWNGATQPPTGVVSGTAITGGMTTQQKCDAVNTWMVVGPAIPMRIPPSVLLNACTQSDLAGLTTAQLQLLQLMLSGNSVDASNGTVLRAVIVAIFAGKASLTSLAALAALYDTPHVPWWQQVGGLTCIVGINDAAGAGLT